MHPDDILIAEPGDLKKPKEGQPCNGCGWCCRLEVCVIGLTFFGKDTKAPCPALTKIDGKHRCSFVLAEAHPKMIKKGIKPIVTESLGIGQGCDAQDGEAADFYNGQIK